MAALVEATTLMSDLTVRRIIFLVDLVSLISDLAIIVKLDLVMTNLDWKWL